MKAFPQKIGVVVILFLPVLQQQYFANQILGYNVFKKGSIPVDLYCVQTKNEFLKLLELLTDRIVNEQYYFFLHLVTHGNKDGLGSSLSEFISWNKLFSYTRKMNILFKGGLMMLLGICVGNSMIQSIDPSLRAPFKTIIGSFEPLYIKDAINAFREFYASPFPDPIFLHDCVDRMNIVVGKTDPHLFHMITDKFCFDKICDPDRDPAFYKNMVYQHVQRITIQGKQGNRSFAELFNDVDRNIRGLLKYARSREDYFLFKK
ncbi:MULTISPECIES: hypothetical protein [Parabacteroides]|uniref:Uncharacterized protein n=3 Tax=Parabacteroides goldsteinii TaxID=328812 RepID=A0A6G1ZGC8_9BACT|nr:MULTISPECIES: hypothetical protein [Parabacteroides]EOS17488.1 hypothetical protein C803_02500 [Parabacteroides goldsteinii dnLKV18]KAI4359859.1 hypothetical protein C825_001906 [Parabacteroides sp. ASF519]MBF0763309.1 hypothetical protein [Parabacteroides goldsteinii]MDZ3928482.1 hypothetical protein [Parabacteroides goldsteinii]MRX95028.1 hypothetical protein [Parabacteroides goldsteinii]